MGGAESAAAACRRRRRRLPRPTLAHAAGTTHSCSVFEAELADHIPVIKASVAGTRLVGRMTVGNRNGLLLPNATTDQGAVGLPMLDRSPSGTLVMPSAFSLQPPPSTLALPRFHLTPPPARPPTRLPARPQSSCTSAIRCPTRWWCSALTNAYRPWATAYPATTTLRSYTQMWTRCVGM